MAGKEVSQSVKLAFNQSEPFTVAAHTDSSSTKKQNKTLEHKFRRLLYPSQKLKLAQMVEFLENMWFSRLCFRKDSFVLFTPGHDSGSNLVGH